MGAYLAVNTLKVVHSGAWMFGSAHADFTNLYELTAFIAFWSASALSVTTYPPDVAFGRVS